MQKIYFPSTYLLISTNVIDGFSASNTYHKWDQNTAQEVIHKLQKDGEQPVLVIQSSIETVLEFIKQEFSVILAGGGLVETSEQDVLLIYRRGKWDLPKGKLDEGETIENCAVREVEEETGLKQVNLGPLLQKTYHTYSENGQSILKETFWYHMQTLKQDLQPQTEEDIQECRWVGINELPSFYSNMQPSVKYVIEAYLNNNH